MNVVLQWCKLCGCELVCECWQLRTNVLSFCVDLAHQFMDFLMLWFDATGGGTITTKEVTDDLVLCDGVL